VIPNNRTKARLITSTLLNPASEATCLQLRKLHQDTEARRNLRSQIRGPGTFTNQHRRIHRRVFACILRWPIAPPEEFERKAEGQAKNRGATIEVFVNNDNDEKISKGLLGAGTEMPSPSPDPFSC